MAEIGEIVSSMLGWIYVSVWTLSGLPQIWYNYKLKSVTGLSVDFVVFNAIGFSLLTIYYACFLWDENTRELYRQKHNGSDNVVEANDFVFSFISTFLALFCLYQITIYRKPGEGITSTGKSSLLALTAWIALTMALWIIRIWTFLEMLYSFAAIKGCITFIKYVPQAYMNYKRKSTIGWSIWSVLLDFIGGMFSMAQLVLDSFLSENLNNIMGNAAKFVIGFISLFFDIIFMIQHYVFYRNPSSCEDVDVIQLDGSNTSIGSALNDRSDFPDMHNIQTNKDINNA